MNRERMLEEALERIASPGYGLQGLVEDGEPPEKIAEYWAGECLRRQAIARAALSALSQDADIKQIVERKGYCFECGHELHAPFCPACNFEMTARPQPTGGNVWRGIESAPRTGGIRIVAPGGGGYAWAQAEWGRDRVAGDAEPREGWWFNGCWMNPQPLWWLDIPPLPPAPSDPRPLDLGGRDD